MNSTLADSWGPPEAYPAVITRTNGIVIYHFPDIPEAEGMVDESFFTLEYMSEQVDEVLRGRLLKKKLYPFASDPTTLEGEVVMVPVKGIAITRLEEDSDG